MNPFTFGSPVRGEDFWDRKLELFSLVSRIRKGNSSLITAEPRLGKTSLLLRLQQPDLYGEAAARLHFCFLDMQMMGNWDVPSFWERALQPLRSLAPLQEAYRAAQKEQFGTFVLERVLARLEEAGERLVLLLDEFDAVLDIPGLHTVEFYGGLRSLASRYRSLSLVIASRQPVSTLNNKTRSFSRFGSPYFNFVEEIPLGPLPLKDTAALLRQAGQVFDAADRRFLERVSGRLPYFLQAAAYYLWAARQERVTGSEARIRAGQECFRQAKSVLQDTWRVWTPRQQMAFTLAALDSLPTLVPGREFDVRHLLNDLPDLTPEQVGLKRRGFLRRAADLPGGYAPQAEIMFWFLAEELTALLRPRRPDIAAWLREQQWEGILKQGEKESLKKAFRAAKPLLREGVTTFIQAAAAKAV